MGLVLVIGRIGRRSVHAPNTVCSGQVGTRRVFKRCSGLGGILIVGVISSSRQPLATYDDTLVLFMNEIMYDDNVIAPLRFKYCPMCTAPLTREVIFDDNIPRVKCPDCDWIQLISNVVGVVVVVRNEQGIVAILPPNEDGVGLPAGLVEYGEDPEAAAIRETFEETGLQVEIIDCLGWYFSNRTTWPGPLVQFMYEAKITGGEIKGSQEGRAEIFPMEEFPAISSKRMGSQRAMQVYISKMNGG